MGERNFEINGNLFGEYGLKNQKDFLEIISIVKYQYDIVFGQEVMNKYELYIDNATKDSGYTPVITPILKKYLIIKLCISDNDSRSKIAYQFAHELTHFVFYSYLGLDKPHADSMEETICSAASLIIIKNLFPDEFVAWNNYVDNLKEEHYRKGAGYALSVEYSLRELKNKIMEFKY